MSSPTRDRAALAARARQITERELEAYSARTTKSQAANARAAKVLPLGVPSSFQFYDPYPVVARRAQGSWLEDVDGNRYVDFNMGYGALLAGHGHPVMIPRSSSTAFGNRNPSVVIRSTFGWCGQRESSVWRMRAVVLLPTATLPAMPIT